MSKWLEGVRPLSNGCQKKIQAADKGGTLGTLFAILGEVPTETHQSGKHIQHGHQGATERIRESYQDNNFRPSTREDILGGRSLSKCQPWF